jgi:hypothetical protein
MPSEFFGSTAVLGIGVGFASDSPQAVKAARAVFPNRNDHDTLSPEPPVYIVLAADQAGRAPAEISQIRGKQLHIVRDGIEMQADGERGRASCSFSLDVIDSELFREAISTIVLFLVAQRGRIPVHASAIVIGDRAYVLAGRSGAGKSALALAGNLAGLPVVAEDTVFVQLDPSFRIWGLADHIHVFEKDAPPGIPGHVRLRSGRLKRALSIGDVRQSADKAALCVLARGDRIRLEPLPPDDAVRALIDELEPGYDFYGTRMDKAIRAIAVGGCWKLTLSHDPNAAISALTDGFRDSGAGERFA